ncbi:MAG TPA: hypothetical protein DDX51_02775 [Clostridiales bacterium]|nr:hypothetical protein [Clostridiales bacterium]
MPNEIRKDFCCLIVCGFGAGCQAGMILCDHLRDSGIDAFLTTPSGKETLRMDQEHWIHGIRMEYLHLRKQYRRVALIGLSIGGMLLLHMLDLNPAALVFVNTPYPRRGGGQELGRVFQADLKSRMHGLLREPYARLQLHALAGETRRRSVRGVSCPTLILQTLDDAVCSPSNADALYKLLQMADKQVRFYPEGGHDVLTSRTVLAVCSDIFQFCSRVRAVGAGKT